MTFIKRYRNGETTEVYSDIAKLGQAAFAEKHFSDIEAVLTETMERVAYNLSVIYDELEHINYNFERKIQYGFEVPLNKPLAYAEDFLVQLETAVSPFGSVPLSLKLFYKIVGSCNFAWDYKTNRYIPWGCSDPIQIMPLDALVEMVTNEYWLEEMKEDTGVYGTPHLDISADYLHKDNISGGPAYAIELTLTPSIDGKFLNEEHQTTFINYLRIIFENCGFGRTKHIESIPTFKQFCDKVGPKLRKI